MQLATPLTPLMDGPKSPVDEQAVARNFSRFAAQYDDYACVQAQIARQALSRLSPPRGEPVLDLGCGTGRHTQTMHAQGRAVTGADLAEGMVAYARTRYPHIPFVVANAQALPFSDCSFGQVFSSMALQWCDAPLTALREVHRILNPGGRAVLAIMVAGSFEELDRARQAIGLPRSANAQNSHHHWCYCAQQLGFVLRHSECVTHQDDHGDILSLLASIKRVGAATQINDAQPASLTRSHLRQLETAYRQLQPGSQSLSLTYRVLHLTLEK